MEGTSLKVQWLGLLTSMGSIPGQGTKISQAPPPKKSEGQRRMSGKHLYPPKYARSTPWTAVEQGKRVGDWRTGQRALKPGVCDLRAGVGHPRGWRGWRHPRGAGELLLETAISPVSLEAVHKPAMLCTSVSTCPVTLWKLCGLQLVVEQVFMLWFFFIFF